MNRYAPQQNDGYDEDGYFEVGASDQLNALWARMGNNPNSPRALQALSEARVTPTLKSQVAPEIAMAMAQMTDMARSLQDRLAIIDAYEQRRPNSICCVYGTSLAPGLTLAFDISPSGGQSWYRLLAFLTGDDQAQVFGFTDLKVGGMTQIFSTQTTPTAPVANASAWYGFVARGDNQVFNLAPWTGTTFSNDVKVTGTIVNMTVAGTGDVITLAPRFLIPCQTDPCGGFTQLYQAAGQQLARNFQRSAQVYSSINVPQMMAAHPGLDLLGYGRPIPR